MKMRHFVVATSAALVSLGAIAGGQQHSEDNVSSQDKASIEATIVREAQGELRSQGYAPTPQGLAEFQQAKGIEPSGKLDEQTLAVLGVDDPAASGASSERAPQPSEKPKD